MKFMVLTLTILSLGLSACDPNYQSHQIASANLEKEQPIATAGPDMKKWLLPDEEIVVVSKPRDASASSAAAPKDSAEAPKAKEPSKAAPEKAEKEEFVWPTPLDEGEDAETPAPPVTPEKQPEKKPETKAPAANGSKAYNVLAASYVTRPDDFKAAGDVTPTVYYIPLVNELKPVCKLEEMVPMLSTSGDTFTKVCPSTYEGCALQGSCFVTNKEVSLIFNHIRYKDGKHHFFEVDMEHCPFGQGVRSGCLDPFYTVAADLALFKAGDVIYVPKVNGVKLPNGELHHGFFIVRDTGGVIDGKGRFDFFSGFTSWWDSKNPFKQLKLTDKTTKIPYYKVSGETAELVKKARNYPSLPGFGPASK